VDGALDGLSVFYLPNRLAGRNEMKRFKKEKICQNPKK
jgi:hypothetical protein